MSFEWSFGVVFELVVGANKLFGAAADKLLVAVVDKLEVDILVVDKLVAASLADKCCGKHTFLAATADWVTIMTMMLMDMADFGNNSYGIETFKKTLYQYIENCINNYLFGDYNISEVRHNLYESLVHYSHLNTQNFDSQTLETYFQELNFNIIQYCEENYPVEQKFSLGFELKTEEEKGKRKQKLRTTPNTSKTTAKHLQTPEQGTSFKLPLSITPFPASLAQPQTSSLPLIRFSRIEDFQSLKSPIQQQKPILTSTNLINYLAEN
ncbi:hypothetical protein G9A89_001193 [Geosiphon pyriformis]|nr:hypothetical protein G9A89_001193 [Geosiphon pyriformis]